MKIYVYRDARSLHALRLALFSVPPIGTCFVHDFDLGRLETKDPEEADYFLLPSATGFYDKCEWHTDYGVPEAEIEQLFLTISNRIEQILLKYLDYFDGNEQKHIFFQLGDLIDVLPAFDRSIVFKHSISKSFKDSPVNGTSSTVFRPMSDS